MDHCNLDIQKKNEEFHNLDDKFIEQVHVAADNRLNKMTKSNKDEYHNFGWTLTKFVLNHSNEFAECDLYQEEKIPMNGAIIGSVKSKVKCKSPTRQWIVRTFYSFCLFSIGFHIFLAYKYDLNKFKLEQHLIKQQDNKFELTTIQTNGSLNSLYIQQSTVLIADIKQQQTIELLKSNIEEYRKINKLFGSPYLDLMPFVEESLLIFLIWSLMTPVQALFLFTFKRANNNNLMRAILNKHREQININNLILSEIDNYITSSWNFIRIFLHTNSKTQNHRQPLGKVKREYFYNDIKEKKPFINIDDYDGNLKILIQKNIQTNLQLKQLTLNGMLQPLNRVYTPSNCLIDRFRKTYGYFWFLFLIFASTFVTLAFFVIPDYIGNPDVKVEFELMDYIKLIQFFLSGCYATASIGFFVAIIAFNMMDQIYAVVKLSESIEHCIRINDKTLLTSLRRATYNKNRSKMNNNYEIIRSEMELNLLYTLMHYKIFARSIKVIQPVCGYTALITLELFVLFPVLGLIHAPFIDGKRVFLLLFGFWTFVFWVYCILAPICYLYCRCLKLCGNLNSLMAHTIRVESTTKDLTLVGGFYNSHLIWLLRKELAHPHQLIGQLSIKVLGSHFTYPFLMQVYFWSGILAISLMYSDEIRKRGGGDLLTASLRFL